jgi:hypothetical protein
MFPSSSRAAGARPKAKNTTQVVFPVDPQRGTMIGRIALIALVASVLGASAAEYLKTEPASLGLLATQPALVVTHPAAPTAIPPAAPVPAPATLAPPPDTAPTLPPKSVPVRVAPPVAKAKSQGVAPHKAPPQRVAPPVAMPVTLPPLPVITPDTAGPPRPGTLFVSSAPWGSVTVDGNTVGNTPVVGMSLAAGPHRVRIVRDGFEPFDRTITVGPGEAVRLTGIVLSARQGP